jgi:hypothetical protein
MACGCFEVIQAMSNGSAVRSGIDAIWVDVLSATVSSLTLIWSRSRSTVSLFPTPALSWLRG